MNGRFLFICISGIGNTILATPLIQLIRKYRPEAKLDLLVHKKVYGECLRGSPYINNLYHLEQYWWQTLLQLRKNRYDISFTCFPSNKWQFNVLSLVAGAKKRCTHKYYVGNCLAFLQNCFIPADEYLHDVEQNVAFARYLDIDTCKIPDMFFAVNEKNHVAADKFLKRNKIYGSDHIIGVHAGYGPMGSRKNWGLRNFKNELEKYQKAKIILFGGENEKTERIRLKKLMNHSAVYLFTGTLKDTAALISRCNYFISNDTALMHIASCFKIKQKAIFISTNAVRTRPWNLDAQVVDNGGRRAYKYPFWSTVND